MSIARLQKRGESEGGGRPEAAWERQVSIPPAHAACHWRSEEHTDLCCWFHCSYSLLLSDDLRHLSVSVCTQTLRCWVLRGLYDPERHTRRACQKWVGFSQRPSYPVSGLLTWGPGGYSLRFSGSGRWWRSTPVGVNADWKGVAVFHALGLCSPSFIEKGPRMRCIVKQLRGARKTAAPVPGLRSPARVTSWCSGVWRWTQSPPFPVFHPCFFTNDSVPNIVLTVSHAECIGAHLSCFRAILTMYLFIIYF